MALWRANATSTSAPGPSAALARALCAVELSEPIAPAQLPIDALRELFNATVLLRDSVPFATVGLLACLAGDGRVDVRTRAAEALADFVDLYPERIEVLLLKLSNDVSRKVRWAATASLAALQSRRPPRKPLGA
jgi:hypothetical protein